MAGWLAMPGNYETLQIQMGASKEEVKQAYLDLARVWHPDRFAGDERLQVKAEEKLREITAAYETVLAQMEAAEEAKRIDAAAKAAAAERAKAEAPPPVYRQWWAQISQKPLVLIGTTALVTGAIVWWWMARITPQRVLYPLPGSPYAAQASVQLRPEPVRARASGTVEAGIGEIRINNDTHTGARMLIATSDNPDRTLQAANVPANAAAIVHNLSPNAYVIDVTFSDRRVPPMRLGPFEIKQKHDESQIEADSYEITLKPAR